MGRETTKRVGRTPDTKRLLDEKKPDGVSHDYYIKHAVRNAPPLPEGE
jgi:hypothetical protein